MSAINSDVTVVEVKTVVVACVRCLCHFESTLDNNGYPSAHCTTTCEEADMDDFWSNQQ